MAKIIMYVGDSVGRSPVSYPDNTSQEKRALAYFQARTAAQLSPCRRSRDRWWRYFLQVSELEPAIRHGVVALGGVHEVFENHTAQQHSHLTPLQALPESHMAVRQYNKAMSIVSRTSTWRHRETPLLACLIFAAFDSLRGRPEPALFHRCSSLRILREMEMHPEHPMHELMMCVFINFDTENLELGEPDFNSPADCQFPSKWLKDPIRGLTELKPAIETFEVLFNRILRALRVDLKATSPGIGPSQRMPDVFLRYEEWCLAVDSYLRACACNLHGNVDDGLSDLIVLQLRRLMVRILLNVDLRYDDMDFDRFNPEFESIVLLAECYANGYIKTSQQIPQKSNHPSPTEGLQHSSRQPRSSSDYSGVRQSFLGIRTDRTPLMKWGTLDDDILESCRLVLARIPYIQTPPPEDAKYASSDFSLAPGIVTPLYITASNCRDPSIRRRALHLLEATHRKEGQWDSLVCAANARVAIAAEEARALQLASRKAKAHGAQLLNDVIRDSWQIPDAARLRGFDCVLNEGSLEENPDLRRFEWMATGNEWRVAVPGCTTQ